jgi:hypothetical protein
MSNYVGWVLTHHSLSPFTRDAAFGRYVLVGQDPPYIVSLSPFTRDAAFDRYVLVGQDSPYMLVVCKFAALG